MAVRRYSFVMFCFEILRRDAKARLGRLTTPHGAVDTPIFMPVGTAGAVKGVTSDQLTAAGVRMVLANTYHLMLRPGAEAVAALGGLHRMMAWSGPILTDSGGYQVFSLASRRSIDDAGVTFRSHLDGSEHRLTPARAIEIQRLLGADVIMQLDECPSGDASKDDVAAAVLRSARWAGQCKDAWLAQAGIRNEQALFGIQQGGVHADLRAASAAALVELDLPGYAIGGLSVGEGHEAMIATLDGIDGQLPLAKPRYLMGVGEPRDILAAVARGVDMFDCVLPTRNGRNAMAFTWRGPVRLRNARHATDAAPLDESCGCYTCRNFSRGVLRHLLMAKEMLGPTLVSIHNLHFFCDLMAAIRKAIAEGGLEERSRQWVDGIYSPRGDRAEEETTG
ncbi:MAG: tRNA guanosine(34) transglycosylase Tgt [Phycisphaerae bacterium]